MQYVAYRRGWRSSRGLASSTVLLDGLPALACLLLPIAVQEQEILTIERGESHCRYRGTLWGEEFEIILPETDGVDAQKIGHRVREHVERHAFPGEERMPGGTLTVSIGVASHAPAGSKDVLPKAADAALYAAKHAGRNRVCVEQ